MALLSIGTAFGPEIGLSMLVEANVSWDITNGIGSALYAMSYPFTVIGATILYLHLKAGLGPVAPPAATAREPAAEAIPRRRVDDTER